MDPDLSKTLVKYERQYYQQTGSYREIIYTYGFEKFCVIEIKFKEGKQTKGKREREIETLKHRLKSLKKEWRKEQDQLKKTGLQTLRDDVRKDLSMLRKADMIRRQKRDKARKCSAFYSDKFTKSCLKSRRVES